jgi:hypothetical protein
MMNENIHLKNRLCEILKDHSDNNLLEELEVFLSRFIQKDEFINLLRNDLAELDKLLKQAAFKDEKILEDIYRSLHEFRNNILIAETRFSDLKIDFNDYLSANV